MGIYHSPLRYPGGKNCIFPFVADLFKKNELTGHAYAEPYAGGAGLALRLLYEKYTPHIYINDLDQGIYSFWKTVTEESHEFCDWVDTVSLDVDTWLNYRSIIKNPSNSSAFQLAQATFYLNRTNVSGVIKGGLIGGLSQNGKYKINSRFNRSNLITRLEAIHKWRKNITVTNYDGVKFLGNLNRRKQNILTYLDPPYVEKGSKLYLNSYNKEDHLKLAKYIQKYKKNWIISYDNNQFIIDTYKNLRKISFNLSQSTSNRVGKEIFIFQEAIKYRDSLKMLKSPTIL
jgi:DNA adenine methylase